MVELKVGDKVRVVNYGHNVFGKYDMVDGKYVFVPCIRDLLPEIIGEIGVIDGVSSTTNSVDFSVHGIPQKHAWYNLDQLEKIM